MTDIVVLFAFITYSLIGTICVLELWEHGVVMSRKEAFLVYLTWPVFIYRGAKTFWKVYQWKKAQKQLEDQP